MTVQGQALAEIARDLGLTPTRFDKPSTVCSIAYGRNWRAEAQYR